MYISGSIDITVLIYTEGSTEKGIKNNYILVAKTWVLQWGHSQMMSTKN